MKKVLTLVLTLTLCLPFTSAFANGKWEAVGEDKFKVRSKIIKSGGGDFKICLVSGPSGYYTLYEDDSFKDDEIGTKTLSKGKCAVFRNINRYLEGNRAELYLKKNPNSGIAHVKFYD
ncbi:hypothetical protein [Shimazuella kribbensis]|uniref:hypothetical protein n=1 Tax=Shimazuella kribbensis TaxID=139808 RepID=UPI0003FEF67D|nr:hypothetical protein [Shimazuella kribbensis]